jgi:hypothetical protein
MAYFISIVGEHELDELSVAFEDVDSQDCTVVLFTIAVYLLEVLSLLVVEQLETNADKIKEGLQVVRRRGSDKDIAVS